MSEIVLNYNDGEYERERDGQPGHENENENEKQTTAAAALTAGGRASLPWNLSTEPPARGQLGWGADIWLV